MNLDKLLKKVEKNALNKDKQEVKKLVIGDDEFEVLTMTRKEKCDFIISLPMRGKIESLNASVAASVMMYEAARQRLGIKAR